MRQTERMHCREAGRCRMVGDVSRRKVRVFTRVLNVQVVTQESSSVSAHPALVHLPFCHSFLSQRSFVPFFPSSPGDRCSSGDFFQQEKRKKKTKQTTEKTYIQYQR